jgi:hypothetical protein
VFCDSIEKDEQLIGSGWTASKDKIRFFVKHESTTTNAIFSADQRIEFKCYETTTSNEFTGVIDTGFSQGYGQIAGPIQIEAVDNSYKLDKKIKTSFQYPSTVGGTPYFIFATSSTGTSILHALLSDAGYSSGEISSTGSILDTVQHVAETEGERTYKQYIDGLLMEYGYTYRFDNDGVFRTVNIRSTSTGVSHTFNNTNIAVDPPLQRSKNLQDHEAVEVKWSELRTLNAFLFTDEGEVSDGSWDDDNDLLISGNYPAGSSSRTIYQKYDPKRNNSPEVIGFPIPANVPPVWEPR